MRTQITHRTCFIGQIKMEIGLQISSSINSGHSFNEQFLREYLSINVNNYLSAQVFFYETNSILLLN